LKKLIAMALGGLLIGASHLTFAESYGDLYSAYSIIKSRKALSEKRNATMEKMMASLEDWIQNSDQYRKFFSTRPSGPLIKKDTFIIYSNEAICFVAPSKSPKAMFESEIPYSPREMYIYDCVER